MREIDEKNVVSFAYKEKENPFMEIDICDLESGESIAKIELTPEEYFGATRAEILEIAVAKLEQQETEEVQSEVQE